MRLAVIFHCFYFDLLDEFFGYFSKIHQDFSLFVTLPTGVYSNDELLKTQNKILDKYHNAVILYCDNYGADIYPCFCVMDYISRNNLHFDKYIKVHTKKSLWKRDKSEGLNWRLRLCCCLFDNLESNLKLGGIVANAKHSTKFNVGVRDLELINYYRSIFRFYGYSMPVDNTQYSVGTMFIIDGDIFEDFFKRHFAKPFNFELFSDHCVLESFERVWELLPVFYNREIHLL